MTELRFQHPDVADEYDVVIVGAGIAGLYAIHKLRDQLGLSVLAVERGDAVGGTWYWNRYPGARCDVESVDYSYSFSPELEQEWEWAERFPAQPDIERYLNHVADRFDLRRDIAFETTVVATTWDAESARWTVQTEAGRSLRAQFVVMGTGCLSSRLDPRDHFEGVDAFEGEWHHTSRWPEQTVDFTGKRVGVIGTGSTGVQLIPQAAKTADHVHVFQRTPNFCVPARNRDLDPEERRAHKAGVEEHRRLARESWSGVPIDIPELNQRPALSVPDPDRRREFERAWEVGGGVPTLLAFGDLLFDGAANDTVADFVRSKIRETVHDPAVAELLCPDDHALGTKRLCVEIDYLTTYNRDNVTLVSVRENPIAELTAAGIRLEDGTEIALDTIVFATGFDAMTGALLEIDIRGRDGQSLRDRWKAGPSTYLGIMASGFPNLFMVTGPQSPSVLSNMVLSIEQHIDWLADAITYARETGIRAIEPNADAQEAWVAYVGQVADHTLFRDADSWYSGANVPGKPRVFVPFVAGVGPYRATMQYVAEHGYEGFELDGEPVPLVDPMVAFVTHGLAAVGAGDQASPPTTNEEEDA